MLTDVDAVIIGGGSGGYVSAIRLGQLGKTVVLVEKNQLGGVCLNEGCIPSKALISAGRLVRKIRESREIGIEVADLKIDFAKTQAWRTRVVQRLVAGVKMLTEGNGVQVIYGEARLKRDRIVEVKTGEMTQEFRAKNIMIATGSSPTTLESVPFDGKHVVDSTQVLALNEVPPRLLIIGGGITGLEIGGMFMDFGSQITLVEMTDRVLPGIDQDISDVIRNNMVKKGARIHVGTKVSSVEVTGQVIRAHLMTGQKEVEEEFDLALVVVGRKPNTRSLGLEEAGVEVNMNGFIRVDQQMRTTSGGIFAIGDIVGPPFLAHKASRQGIIAAEVASGLPSAFDQRALPNTVFTSPEIASVGLSEEEAKTKIGDFLVEKFPFQALGRALTERETVGFVKMISDSKRSQLLGLHIVGPNASDLISEGALAIEMAATVEDIASTIHPHPTLPEGIMEAAEALMQTPIHILRRRAHQ